MYEYMNKTWKIKPKAAMKNQEPVRSEKLQIVATLINLKN